MPGKQDNSAPWSYAVVGLAMVAVVVIFFASVVSARLQSVETVAGTAITAISTLAGLVVGHVTGAAGKEMADRRANAAQRREAALWSMAPPEMLDEAKAKFPTLF